MPPDEPVPHGSNAEPAADATPAPPPDGRPARRSRRLVGRVAQTAAGALGQAVDAGEAIAQLGQPVAERIADVGNVARHVLDATALLHGELPTSRARRVRRRHRQPLPNLFERHPEARAAQHRDLGLLTIPVDEIVGTAVAGAAQRGGDFLPLRALRTPNWRSRWLRVQAAQERLVALPPIDVFRTDDGYWVIDGHNRVAAALYGGQADIDAVAIQLQLPGDSATRSPAGALEAVLADSRELRAAGEGRLTPGASMREFSRDEEPADAERDADGDPPGR